MKMSLFALIASAALIAAPAVAQEASAPAPAVENAASQAAPVRVRRNQTVYAADQSRLGQVDRLTERSAFVEASGGRLIAVPLNSLTLQDGRLVSSLTREQLLD